MTQKRNLSPSQDMAANPAENVWVQANAGTGKTSVLVQRLLRILFRTDPTHPSGILCLTYTNAGAGEMRNRILTALGQWAMASDTELVDLLQSVAINQPANADDLSHARQIFFAYIDNPDMLKIKTIHGFCEEILRRFPLEAGISPSWALVTESTQRILLRDAFQMLVKGTSDVHVRDAFAHIVGRISEHSLDELMAILTTQYKQFFDINDIANYRKHFIDKIGKFLNYDPNTFVADDPKNLQEILSLASAEVNSTKKPAAYLIKLINLMKQYIDKTIDFEEYKYAYLTASGTPISHIAKKEYLGDELNRVYALSQYKLNQCAYEDSVALFDLAAAFSQTYRQIKHERNLMDFDDLILYVRRLFSAPDTMGWVLSQLDVSLSHILVDEAQDTAPQQWDILRLLAGDFFAEGDPASRPRSLFVVGDTKQSIYGFQGADPNAFTQSRNEIATQILQNLRTIREIPLAQSFRSTAPILNTVDYFFDDPDIQRRTGFMNNPHKCFRTNASGVVELHSLTANGSDNGITREEYISLIADHIQSLIMSGEFSASDIMVLVQRRNPFAGPLVRALKARHIDVAGSDRIVLPQFPAIRDLMNLVRVTLNSSDDYRLCCILKSPFYRLTEQDIFNLCKLKQDQQISAFDALKQLHPDIFSDLNEIIECAKTMGPYTFFAHVLNTSNRRAKMIAALGEQIVDPLEEFMTICLAYERTQPGTLRHFLKWFITGGSEIKRDMDASDGVRIVTVHGSKGLEAPVVFMIDTVRTPRDKPEKIFHLPHDGSNPSSKTTAWLWSPQKSYSEHVTIAADATAQDKIAEYYRLLYVAMTRARDRLYIYGFTPFKNASEWAWHTMLWQKLSTMPGAICTPENIRIES